MIRFRDPIDPNDSVIVIDIGNTSIGLATWHAESIRTPLSIPTRDAEAFARAYAAHVESVPRAKPAATVIASVVPAVLQRVREQIADLVSREALVVGDSLPLPMDVTVENPDTVGVDRVCAAAAAFERIQTSCTVVDFGTAVTVDLVDADGAFAGGAILPGLKLQLRALHEFTAALPEVEPCFPNRPFGRNTVEAMQTGVCRGLAGAVRALVEAYATSLNRWPQVVATGGDLEFMAAHCDFIDTPVRHLTLRGVGLAYSHHLTSKGA